MTIKEFLDSLSRMEEEWCMDTNLIRIICNNVLYCPITFLCKKITGKKYNMSEYDRASQDLGLDINDAKEIARAADAGDRYKIELRKQLEQACLKG